MIRKRKLKKRLKKLKRKFKKHRRWTKIEIEQLRQLLSEQSVSYSQAMNNMHGHNMALFKSLQEQLKVKKLDKTILAGILTDLAVKLNADEEPAKTKQEVRHDS